MFGYKSFLFICRYGLSYIFSLHICLALKLKWEFKTTDATLCRLTKNTNHFSGWVYICLPLYFIFCTFIKWGWCWNILDLLIAIYIWSLFIFFYIYDYFQATEFLSALHPSSCSVSDTHVFPYKVVMQQTLEEGHLCKSNISILTTAFPCSFLVFENRMLKW